MASKKTSPKLLNKKTVFKMIILIGVLVVGGFYVLTTYTKTTFKKKYVEDAKVNMQMQAQQVPSEFPKDFPVPKNTVLVSSWTNEDKGDLGVSVIWTTTQPYEDLVAFYTSELQKSGYKVLTEFKNKPSYTASFSKGNIAGYVGIAQANETTISVTVGFDK